MSSWWRAFDGGLRTQLRSFLRTPMTAFLVLILPINLLLLLSLFALTGYNAPTALVMGEDTAAARSYVEALEDTHNSFELRPMDLATAQDQLKRARLVAILEIPPGFEAGVQAGHTVPVNLTLDNVNLDMAEDVRRAVPAAAVIFAARNAFPEVRIEADLRNLLPRDTGYVQYLGVSAVALAACIAGAVLGGTVTAREWELGTARLSQLAPGGAAAVLAGRLAAAAVAGVVASSVTALIVWFGYSVHPVHPLEVGLTLVATVFACTMLGGLVGAGLRRVMPVAPLLIGTLLPFYLDSGALEPQRFDGEWLFALAHLSPTYYSVGVMEHAYHGLVVTPEPRWLLLLALVAIGLASLAALPRVARR
ncbi:MAG: ABC transporter permease [Frankiaceae bacterium]|nr:ABC transporter permease [Frankiaceae bacterium]